MANVRNVMVDLKAAFFMVMVQVAYATVSILYKVITQDGMSLSVLIAYRALFASSFIVPVAIFMERKSKPKITKGVLFQAFFCGLFGGCLQQNLYLGAVVFASATYATAMFNLIPGVTFIFAVCFGLEVFNIETSRGRAKVLGTLMGIGGAMILTFWKSIELPTWSTHVNVMRAHLQPHHLPTNQIWGCAMAFGGCVSYSTWLIIQARMCEKFPWHYTSVALMSIMASIQSVVFALCMERDWSQWKLGWNIKLLTIVIAGIVASGISWFLIEWCVRIKGPLYTAIFNPLFLVLVAIASSLVLDEKLYLGSIIGSSFIVFGLYIVLWGKSKDLKTIDEPKLTKGPIKGESEGKPLEIITTNRVNDNYGEITC